MRPAVLLLGVLLLPLVYAGLADDMAAMGLSPVTVDCGKEYTLFVRLVGDAVVNVILSDGENVLMSDSDFQTYMEVVSAFIYKNHISGRMDDVIILNPKTISQLSSLQEHVDNKKIDFSVAKSYASQCVPEITDRIDVLESMRQELYDHLTSLISELSAESEKLTDYMRSEDVDCAFSVDVEVYDDVKSLYSEISDVVSYSKDVRADLAVADTNCDPATLKAISDSLDMGISLNDVSYLVSNADTEKEIFEWSVPDSQIRTLFLESRMYYWKNEYEGLSAQIVESDVFTGTLEQAIDYILQYPDAWERSDLVDRIREGKASLADALAKKDYERAYTILSGMREDVERVLQAGFRKEENGFTIPSWVYAVILLLGGIILWKIFKGKGGADEEDMDYDYGFGSAE